MEAAADTRALDLDELTRQFAHLNVDAPRSRAIAVAATLQELSATESSGGITDSLISPFMKPAKHVLGGPGSLTKQTLPETLVTPERWKSMSEDRRVAYATYWHERCVPGRSIWDLNDLFYLVAPWSASPGKHDLLGAVPIGKVWISFEKARASKWFAQWEQDAEPDKRFGTSMPRLFSAIDTNHLDLDGLLERVSQLASALIYDLIAEPTDVRRLQLIRSFPSLAQKAALVQLRFFVCFWSTVAIQLEQWRGDIGVKYDETSSVEALLDALRRPVNMTTTWDSARKPRSMLPAAPLDERLINKCNQLTLEFEKRYDVLFEELIYEMRRVWLGFAPPRMDFSVSEYFAALGAEFFMTNPSYHRYILHGSDQRLHHHLPTLGEDLQRYMFFQRLEPGLIGHKREPWELENALLSPKTASFSWNKPIATVYLPRWWQANNYLHSVSEFPMYSQIAYHQFAAEEDRVRVTLGTQKEHIDDFHDAFRDLVYGPLSQYTARGMGKESLYILAQYRVVDLTSVERSNLRLELISVAETLLKRAVEEEQMTEQTAKEWLRRINASESEYRS